MDIAQPRRVLVFVFVCHAVAGSLVNGCLGPGASADTLLGSVVECRSFAGGGGALVDLSAPSFVEYL